MKIKVSTAERVTLDWMVAKAEGKNGVLHDDGITRCIVIAAPSGVYKGTFKPTENWNQGGPIIERERISIRQWINVPIVHAYMPEGEWSSDGQSPLIAAMRCYVVSKLGEEVEVPDDLT